MITEIEITHEVKDSLVLRNKFHNTRCGGLVIFEGLVRDHHEGRAVTGLSYEAYIPMTKKMLLQIAHEARQKFGVADIVIYHRLGNLNLGDIAVWMGVNASHRAEAFLACEYMIDELKRRAPIWKKEHYLEGESQWVECFCVAHTS